MSRIWIRGNTGATLTSTGLGTNVSIYSNGRTITGQLTLSQKVTVIATFLMAIEDVGDLWSMRLMVVEESVTPTATTPELEDIRMKGVYPLSKGPVYFAPRRLISVPTEHELFLQLTKEAGGTSSTVRCYYNILLNTSLA